MEFEIVPDWYGYKLITGIGFGGGEIYEIRIIRKRGKLTVVVPPMHEYTHTHYMLPEVAEVVAEAIKQAAEFCRQNN